jgi:cephalosporin hydroxylase
MAQGVTPRTQHGLADRQSELGLPPPVSITFDETLGTYWDARIRQSFFDSYAGVPIGKLPEDLRVYEHLLWTSRANVVVEIGTDFGGSALWFRDRLATMVRYGRITRGRVFSIDTSVEKARKHTGSADPNDITLIEGDVCDPAVADRVTSLLPEEAVCFVIEDSAHTYETTRAALDGFSHLVPLGGYFVVEDGCVDIEEMRITEKWPRGVLPALNDWLASERGSQFTQRRDLERYGLSCHPHGFLQRARERPDATEPLKATWPARWRRAVARRRRTPLKWRGRS